MTKPSIDFSINSKQKELFTVVMKSTITHDYYYIAYGGAIRGGKTYGVLGILAILCKMYPHSKWVVVRSDFPALSKTTIPSLEKIIDGSTNWKWHRDKSNYYVEYVPNGAKIYFFGENISIDPELNTFLGFECNGMFLEQSEELSVKMWEMAIQRSGSHYTEPMPPPFVFTTFNPTQNWVKKKFYVPFKNKELQAPYYFIEALPNDNPKITEAQWKAWEMLDPINRKRMIEGDWNAYDGVNKWAYAYSEEKHSYACEYDPYQPLYLSFDFNRNPICAGAIQDINESIRVPYAFKLKSSNIYELYGLIKRTFEVDGHIPLYIVTGDATGKNSSALVVDNINYYTIITKELNLSDAQIQVPSINPRMEENQVLVNSILQNADVQIHPERAASLHFDLGFVEMTADGRLKKVDRNDPTQQADSLDWFRYWCNTFKSDFIKLIEI